MASSSEGRGGRRLRALRGRLEPVLAALTPSDVAWRGATRGHVVMVACVVLALGVFDLGTAFTLPRLAGFVGALASLLVVGGLVVVGLAVIGWLSVGYRRTVIALLPVLALSLFFAGPTGIPVIALALSVVAALLGGSLAVLRRERTSRTAWVTLGLGLVGLIGGPAWLLAPRDDPNPALADVHLEDRTLDLPDPGAAGPWSVRTFTYGPGTDRHRPELGAGVDRVSRSVDGSKLVDHWSGPSGWLRTRYWGFDATALPLQGRAWVPEGDGPFPIVLMVHGNHDMERSSDPGYAYLGEHLASRGIVAVSVDENFLNGSTSDLIELTHPGLDEENDARAWLLLEHLRQWDDWNTEPGGDLQGLVDLDRVALLGHSRGGEAVAHAAAFAALQRYPDDATVALSYDYGVRGVIAIAPCDGQYEPRDRPTALSDVSYLVLHGSLDGDVTSFMGAAQYARVALTPGQGQPLKSSLYVIGANHGQFNTTWGRNDLGGPATGWLLDTRPIMDPEDQRTVAKVTIAAFLDVVLRDDPAYLPVLRDVRHAAAWLPDIVVMQRYADGTEQVVASFEEDLDPATATLPGSRIRGEGLTRWREAWLPLKSGDLDTHTAVVAWDDRVSTEPASLSLRWPIDALATGPDSRLVFAVSAVEEDTLPPGWADEHPDELGDDPDPGPLDWSVEVRDADGRSATLPLSHDRPLYPTIQGPTRRASFLEIGAVSEIVLHRQELSLADFLAVQPALDVARLVEVRFVFDASPRGAFVLDDVRITPPSQGPAESPDP